MLLLVRPRTVNRSDENFRQFWFVLFLSIGAGALLLASFWRGIPGSVRIQRLPSENGSMSQWLSASTAAALLQSNAPQVASYRQSPIQVSPAPVRVIRDTHPTHSAVVVDSNNNKIILQDENLFQIMVYDRMANTPANATFTEPKRIIGGNRSKVEFNCALYVDPQSGDIYTVNNDTLDTTSIFSRAAKGNVPPDRVLHTPHGTYGIAVDEARQELFLTVEHTNAVVIYPKMAKDDEAALRTIQGDQTASKIHMA